MPEKLLVSHVLAGNQHEGPHEVQTLLYHQCIPLINLISMLVSLSHALLASYYSQELLEAVEEERNAQENHACMTTIFCHPLLGDFEVLTYMMFTFRVCFH